MKAHTVSEVVLTIKSTLEGGFKNLYIEGEVTNISRSASGHIYFSLRDKDSSLSCALFKMDAYRNPIIKKIADGDKVTVQGSIGVYQKRGTFQVIAKRINKLGVGDLAEQFELLKKKLNEQGLFDLTSKVKIPQFAKRIAVITSPEGAALQDFINIFSRRSMWMDLMVVPALVQGEHSPRSLREALFNTIKFHLEAPEDKKIDVIVLTRGGGSMEDLWSFNDEALAWDIFNCPIPVISAVGHEVDFSISDMVADLRVETPSAAAELLTDGQNKLKEKMSFYSRALQDFAGSLFLENKLKLEELSPEKNLEILSNKLLRFENRLMKCNLIGKEYEYTGLHDKLLQLEDLLEKLGSTFPRKVEDLAKEVDKQKYLLDAINPKSVLNRGYSYLEDENGNVVESVKAFSKLSKDTLISAQFNDGRGEMRKV